jgi:predicted RNA-binding protein with PUA-like domain
MAKRKYWLFKSEPDVYGIADLERDGSTTWEGVRNYQARNFLRDDCQVGDGVLYYHSNTKPPGIVGVARVSRGAYPDPYQFDEDSKYYDPKAKPEAPPWVMVDVELVARFDEVLTLDQLKADAKLDGMLVTRKGQRLSIQPVEAAHWRRVCKLAGYRES